MSAANDRDPDPIGALAGAYDTHLHVGPDIVPRALDFLDAAREAAAAGMAGIVFKDTGQPTVDRAHAARMVVPGIAVYGGIVLDHAAGGINPVAVERCLKLGGRFVWMPVVDALHTTRLWAAGTLRVVSPPSPIRREPISLLDGDGELTEDTRAVVALIAAHDAVLATGHIAPAEALALVAYARQAGVRRIIVNHPSAGSVGASPAVQRELAAMGALQEHCFAQTTPGIEGLPVAEIAAAIRAVGSEHCLLATDLGQAFNPRPVAGLRLFLAQLHAAGIPMDDLRRMTRDNPARLVG